MKRLALLPLLSIALLVPAPAQASPPYLSYGEATRVIGRNLIKNFYYGAKRGSLRADCWRLARNRVRCYISFLDLDHDAWCGTSTVRENRAFYSISRRVNLC